MGMFAFSEPPSPLHRFWHLANWASRLVRRDRKLSESFFWLGFEIHKKALGVLLPTLVFGGGALLHGWIRVCVCVAGPFTLRAMSVAWTLDREYLVSTYDE